METGVSLAQHIAKGVFPTLHGRTEKYPEGECTDDLARRAEQAIEEIVMPYVWQAAKEGLIEMHVAIVSHGLSISEIVAALVRKDAGEGTGIRHYRGLMNTAWTRVSIEVKVRSFESFGFFECLKSVPKNVKEGELQLPDNDPPLVVRVIDFNSHQHLEKIVSTTSSFG
jgi:broad specificity phosphatase PhoE